jgi:hypothetical protein
VRPITVTGFHANAGEAIAANSRGDNTGSLDQSSNNRISA